MRRLLLRPAAALGLDAWRRWRNRRKLLVLMYHGVVEAALRPFCWHQVPRPAFRRQMEWVQANYRVLPLEEALALRAAGRLPPRTCAITFDDGYRNVATEAVPVLQEFGLRATVFVVTDLLGTDGVPWPDRLWLAFAASTRPRMDLSDLGLGPRAIDTDAAKASVLDEVLKLLKARPVGEKDTRVKRIVAELDVPEPLPPGPFAMMSWEETRALDSEGLVTFGPHSLSHEILSRCDDAEVERQVGGSITALADRLGRRPRVFAYPNGDPDDFDERAKAAVRRSGLPWALSTVAGLVDEGSDDLALPRIAVGADLSLPLFRALSAGL